jgi:CBS domain-containing protein
MKVRQLMTPNAQCVSAQASLAEAAALMQQLNVGALPVCDHDQLAGMITDRDITIRAVSLGRSPTATMVSDAMSSGVIYIHDDQEADDAAKLMECHQVRRLPVLDREKRLVGIISLGDLAVESEHELTGEILKEVSMPSAPMR